MADNRPPNLKRTEIVLAWLGMAGAVALLGGWSPNSAAQKNEAPALLPAPHISSVPLCEPV